MPFHITFDSIIRKISLYYNSEFCSLFANVRADVTLWDPPYTHADELTDSFHKISFHMLGILYTIISKNTHLIYTINLKGHTYFGSMGCRSTRINSDILLPQWLLNGDNQIFTVEMRIWLQVSIPTKDMYAF